MNCIFHHGNQNDYLTKLLSLQLKFNINCLNQPKMQYTHGTTVNIYIVYELGGSSSNDSDPTLKIVYSVQLL